MGQEYIREGKRFLYEESGIGVVEIKSRFLYTKFLKK